MFEVSRPRLMSPDSTRTAYTTRLRSNVIPGLGCAAAVALMATAIGVRPAHAADETDTADASLSATETSMEARRAAMAATFDEHVTVLASPFFEGRIPGSEGLERAADYIEFNLMRFGLVPAFGGDLGSSMSGIAFTATDADGSADVDAMPDDTTIDRMASPWRQPFTVGATFSNRAYAAAEADAAESEDGDSNADSKAASIRTLQSDNTESPGEGVITWNVGGMLPGRGDLADEWIVIGAHYDHLGRGYFGSRGTPGDLHPGADDNASGVAGVLLAAEQLSSWHRGLEDSASARSVLFLFFSGEESGLNGSRHYVQNPVAPIDDHVLMINFDMIGRVKNDRLAISGTESGEGLKAWLQPYFDASPLDEVFPESVSARSDHAPFYRAGVPVLFAIIADFHDDYHTPNDRAININAEGGAETAMLFAEIIADLATRAERFAYAGDPAKVGAGEGGPSFRNMKVRFGIIPAHYDESRPGVAVQGVSPNTSAERGGVLPGDELMRWNGVPITGIRHWMSLLAEHEPGDVVEVEVMRDGESEILEVELFGRDQ